MPKITVLTDGRAGNENQALALAKALVARGRGGEIETLRAEMPRWAEPIPPAVLHALGLGLPSLGTARGAAGDLIIGTGRRVAAGVAVLGRRGAATVQLMDPQMAPGAFDAVIAPAHDGLEAPNALATQGALTQLDATRLEAEAALWQDRLPPNGIGVLLGGPSKSAPFPEAEQDRLLEALQALAASHPLLITPSRRTPERLLARLEAALPEGHFLWDGTGENPYHAIMGGAEAFLVTADSVNMATEAASTGKPVHIFDLPGLAPKHRRFHQALANRGASRVFDGALERWTYEPLAEVDRAADWLLERLGWR